MDLVELTLFSLALLKLSCDDLTMHRVFHNDLIVLCVLGLHLFVDKTLSEWLMMVGLIVALGLYGHHTESLGSGDLPVILSIGLTLSLTEWLNALWLAALLALFTVIIRKKASHEALPFVPYLSLGWMMVYLIRFRLIFS
jgi:prepilin signal peptidase PulO-like enzyme (type II secretory pathway)